MTEKISRYCLRCDREFLTEKIYFLCNKCRKKNEDRPLPVEPSKGFTYGGGRRKRYGDD